MKKNQLWKTIAIILCSFFSIIVISRSSLSIFQPNNNLIDVFVAICAYLGFYLIVINIIKLFYWFNGKEFN